jgi:hypothetical protein
MRLGYVGSPCVSPSVRGIALFGAPLALLVDDPAEASRPIGLSMREVL